ncbi:uncharacterized protein LOC132733975 [Ruditapes philippinarum]|uniref:uncharacterized protein LOC132733975 n=1 Tax=Ruditapes philippinarum TaxID=129788 RepID=UPI00295B59D4|nr:uncharacterized protein LOC132733975 [Ruditapes philippinarum]
MDICGPCKFRNEDKKAIKYCLTCEESQCNTCADIHASSKATRKHLLLAITDLNKTSKTTEDLEKFQNCNDHTDKKIEFFCIDHEHFLCSTCLLNISELKCKSIVDIETGGEHLLTTRFNERISKDLDDVTNYCREQENEIQRMIEKGHLNKQEIQKYITDLKHKVINQFEKCEKDILDKVDTTVEKRNSELKSQQTVLKEARTTASGNRDMLHKIVGNNSSADIFRCSFSLIEQMERLPINEVSMTTEICSHSVELSPIMYAFTKSVDSHPLMYCKTTTSMSTQQIFLKITEDKGSFLKTTKQVALKRDQELSDDYMCSSSDVDVEGSNADSKDVPAKDFKVKPMEGSDKTAKENVQSDGSLDKEKDSWLVHISDNVVTTPDGKQPEITDIATLTDGCIILSDSKWSRLLRFTTDLTHKDTAELSHPPGKLAVLNDQFLVVCLPTGNRIAFVSVSSGFKWMRNVKTLHSPRGIQTLDNSHLLVSMKGTSYRKWHLHVITTDGKLKQDIGKTRSIQDAFMVSAIKSTHASPRYYLQCCTITGALYCYSVDGKELFKYSVRSPKYLYVEKSGNIYLLDSFGKLHILDSDGKRLQTCDVPKEANGLTCSNTKNKLFLTKHSSPVINVFQVVNRQSVV